MVDKKFIYESSIASVEREAELALSNFFSLVLDSTDATDANPNKHDKIHFRKRQRIREGSQR